MVAFALLPVLPIAVRAVQAAVEEEEEEEEEVVVVEGEMSGDERSELSVRQLALKGLVAAGTAYGLTSLYTGPKIESETRSGEEVEGERVRRCRRCRFCALLLTVTDTERALPGPGSYPRVCGRDGGGAWMSRGRDRGDLKDRG